MGSSCNGASGNRGSDEDGGLGVFRLLAQIAVGLEFAELGQSFAEQAMGLGAGAVDGFLDTDGALVVGFHGVERSDGIGAKIAGEMRFDETAAAQTPGGAKDFQEEDFFEGAGGSEVGVEAGFEGLVVGLFAGTDEVAGEKAEHDGVPGGFRFTLFRAGAGGMPRIGGVGGGLCEGGHFSWFLRDGFESVTVTL